MRAKSRTGGRSTQRKKNSTSRQDSNLSARTKTGLQDTSVSKMKSRSQEPASRSTSTTSSTSRNLTGSTGSRSQSQYANRSVSRERDAEKTSKLPKKEKKGLARLFGRGEETEGIFKLFERNLQDMYWAENYLLKALPKMADAASDEELIDAIENHLGETEEQVKRLEEIFDLLDLEPRGNRCEAMEGLIDEGNEAISEFEEGPVRDAAIIISAQKVEHYEIAAYGSLRALAELMQRDDVADLLQETLDEEGNADKVLNEISEDVNEDAYRETYAH